MQRNLACTSVLAGLLLSVGQSANAQAFQKSRPVHQTPRSLYEMYGVRAGTAPSIDWQSKFVPGTIGASVPLPLIVTDVDTAGGPAGTERMYVYRNPPYHCVTAALYDGTSAGWSTVFDKNFTTGPGTKYLQVVYTTQANVNDGVDIDGLAIQCLVTQGTTTVPCSNTDLLPFLLSRTSNGRGNSVVVTYSGYVALDPDTSTNLLIQVAVGVSGTIASACANNLIIRY